MLSQFLIRRAFRTINYGQSCGDVPLEGNLFLPFLPE